jgi:hypothetical protein
LFYADESGDHGLRNIDPSYPVFVLAFVILCRDVYVDRVGPALHRLKFRYWGHDAACGQCVRTNRTALST